MVWTGSPTRPALQTSPAGQSEASRLYRFIHPEISRSQLRPVVTWYIQCGKRYQHVQRKLATRCGFPSQMDALRELMRAFKRVGMETKTSDFALGCSLDAFQAYSRYKNVKRLSAQRYSACKNRVIKYFSSEKKAAQFAAGSEKIQQEELPLDVFTNYSRAFFTMYQDIGWLVPGDTASLCEIMANSPIVQKNPETFLICILGKYRPFMDAFLQAWEKQGVGMPKKRISCKKSFQLQRAERCIVACRDALRLCDGNPMEVWVRNCGHKVSHHTGYLATMGALKLIQRLVSSWDVLPI
jgi:hypothetical protein